MRVLKNFFNALFLISIALNSDAVFAAEYRGDIIVTPLRDGRNLRVLEKFSFIDDEGQEWIVPVGTITDGASVPQVFWSIFPPFSGKYRAAAIVHDYQCQIRSRPWKSVHRVFYDAMVTSEVEQKTASIMYAAVYAFGPRWSVKSDGSRGTIKFSPLNEADKMSALNYLELWVSKNNPSRAEIEMHIREIGIRQLGADAVR